MASASFDLTPFGVPHVLRPGFDFKSIKQADLRYGMRTEDARGRTVSFVFGEDSFTVYRVLETLGEGTYGVAYKVVAPDGELYAMKYIKEKLTDKKEFIAFIKECIIQLLVVEASKTKHDGPYAPIIYEICYNEETGEGYIRSELMRNTLENLVSANSQKANDMIVPDCLLQMSTMLDDLQKSLLFNHRDMKGDNIMYIKLEDDVRLFRLIDFGMSCITWHGLKISGSSWFDEKHSCFRKQRDLSQLYFYLQRYLHKYLSDELLFRLQHTIVANVGGRHVCKMYKLCPAHGLKKWKNVYNFVDRANVDIPGGNPNFVKGNMTRFLEGKNFKSPRGTLRRERVHRNRTRRADTADAGNKLKILPTLASEKTI
jgi:serine/threonine protein kinase